MTKPFDMIIADPNILMLQALSDLFDRDQRFRLIATCKSAEGFLESCLRVPVSVAVIEWNLPKLGGEQVLQILRARETAPRIVIYSSLIDKDIARRAMAGGAAGFCTRETPSEQLLDIVATVANGRMAFPFVDVRSLKSDPREHLTTREKTMIAALAKGRTNIQLAEDLGISVNTVKFHLRNLYDKLGLRNRSQAIAFFYAHIAELNNT